MSAPPPPSVRAASVDLFRAIAIVAVVLIHVWGPSTEVTPDRSPLHAAVFSCFVAGSVWAVPGFFFLSGLMLSQRPPPETWPEHGLWWRRRLARLLPPYLFWSALMLVVAGRWDPVGVVVRLLTGNASYQMYFVIALLQAYLLWSLAMPWLRRRPQATQTAILVGAFALSVAVHILRAWYLEVNHADFLAFSRTTVFPWIGYFALGCLTGFGDIALISPPSRQVSIVSPDSQEAKGNFGDRQRDPMRPGLAVSHVAPAAFAILALMVAYDVSYHGPHQDPPQNTLLKPAYAVVMIWLVGRLGATWAPRMGERSRRFAAALARDSYGIYLSHVLVMGLLSRVVYIQLAGLSLPLELAYRIVALIITVAAAWGLVRLLSLIPGVRYLSGADVRWDSGT